MPKHVIDFTFKIGNSAGHASGSNRVLLHLFHREYFYADIDDASAIEQDVLYKKIVSDKSILAKLHFNGDLILHEVGLLIRSNWMFSTPL